MNEKTTQEDLTDKYLQYREGVQLCLVNQVQEFSKVHTVQEEVHVTPVYLDDASQHACTTINKHINKQRDKKSARGVRSVQHFCREALKR